MEARAAVLVATAAREVATAGETVGVTEVGMVVAKNKSDALYSRGVRPAHFVVATTDVCVALEY